MPTQEPTTPTPDKVFDLAGWKLQIPGPREIKNLRGYTSQYFYLNNQRQLCCQVDATETGSTANSEYVRAELRHLAEWDIRNTLPRTLAATIQVASSADPDKVTVMQIHGINPTGAPPPPLLRVALNEGALYAFIKTTQTGTETASTLLASGVGTQSFRCTISVAHGWLTILVNGEERIHQDLSYWPYACYFKAGCYPQAHQGIVTVAFSSLTLQQPSS